uniref:3Beta_HSD domain-containing protein n=1 Tax=Heterorhabditis bacteriophora TaxID=37862 RepID=A0A1I7WL25_HETBA
MFSDFPRNYLLGEYGESRTRGEMYARKAIKRESCLSGIFLRPVHVHGEGGSISQDILYDMANKGQIPYIEGDRRGMHQFIYAGNLSGIVEKALIGLASEPAKFSGEIIYCLDDTNITPYREKNILKITTITALLKTTSRNISILIMKPSFKNDRSILLLYAEIKFQFLENRVSSPLYSKDVSVSIGKSFLCSYFSYLKYQTGFEVRTESTVYYAINSLTVLSPGQKVKKCYVSSMKYLNFLRFLVTAFLIQCFVYCLKKRLDSQTKSCVCSWTMYLSSHLELEMIF